MVATGALLPLLLPPLGASPHPGALQLLSPASGPAATVPGKIIQLGAPHSATTLQFVSLCGAMFLVHESVQCTYAFIYNASDTVLNDHSYEVQKLHHQGDILPELEKLSAGPGVWLFTTSSNASAGSDGNVQDWQPTAAAQSKQIGWPVKYTQVEQLLDQRGYLLAEDYAKILCAAAQARRRGRGRGRSEDAIEGGAPRQGRP